MSLLYQHIYALAKKLSKRDRFGIHLKIENLCLECLQSSITAAFQAGSQKASTLQNLRIQIEVLKRLIRSECELKIIDNLVYWRLQKQLEECSKMTTGWLKYLMQNRPT